MARPKGQLPRSADLAFIRKAITVVNEIRSQRKFADQHVDELRLAIAKRVANALWGRYRVYLRKEKIDARSFLDWLVERERLEATYLHHSYQTRLYWVYRVITTTRIPELALFNESADQYGYWYFDLLEELINEREPNKEYRVRLYQTEVEAEHIEGPVPTIRFEKELRSPNGGSTK